MPVTSAGPITRHSWGLYHECVRGRMCVCSGKMLGSCGCAAVMGNGVTAVTKVGPGSPLMTPFQVTSTDEDRAEGTGRDSVLETENRVDQGSAALL